MSSFGGRVPTELITEEGLEELEEAIKSGVIATIARAYRFLLKRGVHHAYPDECRRASQAQEGEDQDWAAQHKKADEEEQGAFKTALRRSSQCVTVRLLR